MKPQQLKKIKLKIKDKEINNKIKINNQLDNIHKLNIVKEANHKDHQKE
jgi:hypothetical protein